MLSLSQLKIILRENNIRPSKRLGQNFLIDRNIQKKIINASDVCREDIVLEIGPGLGSLTRDLCNRAGKVISIEKDKRLYDFLLHHNSSGNLELIQKDILKYNFSDLHCRGKVKVIGNLPYYISSPILIKLINNRPFIKTIFVTVQREFGERLVAGPGSKDYGSISCFVKFYAEPAILFKIKKTAFYPTPKVDSCFLKIDLRDRGLYLTDEEKLFKIIRSCFEKRRKTILNSLYSGGLSASKQEVLEKLKMADMSPARRPETISLKEFTKISLHF